MRTTPRAALVTLATAAATLVACAVAAPDSTTLTAQQIAAIVGSPDRSAADRTTPASAVPLATVPLNPAGPVAQRDAKLRGAGSKAAPPIRVYTELYGSV